MAHKGGMVERVSVLIVGTGPFAQGFAKLAQSTGAVPHSFSMAMGSRRLAPGADAVYLPGLPDVPIVPMVDGLEAAQLIVLACPASAMTAFVQEHAASGALRGKVAVDVSNPWANELELLIKGSCSRQPSMELDAVTAKPPSPSPSKEHRGHISIVCSAETHNSDGGSPKDDSNTKLSSCPSYRQPESVAEWLQQALDPFGCRVVKAFNNLSAYMLTHGDPLTDHMQTVISTNDAGAAAEVAELARAMGIAPRIVNDLSYARTMETWQRPMLASWQMPSIVMFVMWVCIYIYASVRYNHYGGVAWYHTILFILNKSMAWASLWGMAATFMPGMIITCTLLVTRKPQLRLWGWFKNWMDSRKQLGLITFAEMLMHLFMSAFLWLPSYFAKLFESDTQVVPALTGASLDKYGLMKTMGDAPVLTTSAVLSAAGTVLSLAPNAAGITLKTVQTISLHSQANMYGELVILTGLISGALMCMTAITSMPAVTPKLNWREWRLLQSWFSWWGLCLATAHTMLLAPVPAWNHDKGTWPVGIPTITLTSVAPCLLLIAIKIVLIVPPVPWFLRRIRAGYYKKGTLHAAFC